MTSPSGPSAVGQAAASDVVTTGSPAAAEGQARTVPGLGLSGGVGPSSGEPPERGYDPGPVWARYLPPVLAIALGLWRITEPSYWRDEAATVAAVSRPFGDMIRVLGNVDAVHSLYYMMMWPLAHLFGTGEFVLRFPSVIAAAVAVTMTAAIGRRLISPWAGLAAGVVLAILPVTSRYAQEARSYEMVVAVAIVASYLLVRVLAAGAGQRRRWVIGYGISIAALGVLNVFGLLLVPAHAVTVALYWRRRRDSATRRLAVGWLIATAAGVVITSPLLVLGWAQRAQIAWLQVNTSSSGINTVFSLPGSYFETTAILGILVVAVILSLDKPKEQRGAAWPRLLVELTLPWLAVPPFILFVISAVHPVYTSRYILMCLPALALLVGAAVVTFGRIGAPVAVAVVLAAGFTAQLAVRGPAGHFDDIRALDTIVAAHARPGDAVLYTNPNAESFGKAYSYGLGKLPNVGISQAAIPSGTLGGRPATLAQIRAALMHVKRVWVVEINSYNSDPYLLGLNGEPVDNGSPIMNGMPFAFSDTWREHADYLVLFTRTKGS